MPLFRRANPERVAMNDVISWILQGGVIVSAAIICLGCGLLLLRSPHVAGQPLVAFPHTPGEVWLGLWRFSPQAYIALGLLLLIATPVLRVMVSILAFAREHDRRYVVITSLVLLVLCLSFFLGKGA
jgi:uncharacterized membrane protein